ncbi:MAG TPA: RNA methyltransferase [Bacteroidales bacterium]|nr:RNA methyltransferase [Bacteroidales bacterium]
MKKDNEILRLVAKTTAGLENVLADELKELGAQNIEIMTRAVGFEADKKLMYRTNYRLRTALQILRHVKSFKAGDEQELYNQVYNIKWQDYLDVDKTFAIDAVVSGGRFTHSQFVVFKAKDAIADHFRNRMGKRPSVDTQNPYLRINLHISADNVNLSFNTSGDSLHKRGYREIVDKAPINEVLAAGLILLSGWKADCHFVDSMCGSATIPIEAAMMAMQIPAGYYRKSYGFMNWHDFDPELWEEVMNEADSMICEFDHEIIGSDRSQKAIEIARQNVRKAHLHKDIRIIRKNMEELTPPKAPGILIINPPYGERLEEKDIKALYSSIGDSLKRNFTGYKAWIISSDFHALKHIGLKPSKKLTVYNGPLECRFVCYDIFEGKHKDMRRRESDQSSLTGRKAHK